MTIKALVITEKPDSYTSKKGQQVNQQTLTVLDQEPGVNRLSQPLEYALSEEEKAKWANKLQDKTIQLGIRELIAFGGRLRVRGAIVSVDGVK